MIQKNWKPYILGIITGTILVGLFFAFTDKEKSMSTDTPVKVTNNSATSNSKRDDNVTKTSEIGTLTNPVPFGDYAEFSDTEFLGEETFKIGVKIEEFKPAQDLPDFEARFYNDKKLMDNNTYYGANINIKVLDGSDPNTPYYFDSLNNVHVFIDGAESSDNVIDINQNEYSGVDGNISIGAEKTGWIGFQVPSHAKNILIKVGSYNSNFYMKLK